MTESGTQEKSAIEKALRATGWSTVALLWGWLVVTTDVGPLVCAIGWFLLAWLCYRAMKYLITIIKDGD